MTDTDLNQIGKLLKTELTSIDAKLDGLSIRLDQIEARLDKVDARLGKVESRLDKAEHLLHAVDEQVARLSLQVSTLDENIKNLQEEFIYQKRLMRQIERHMNILADVYEDNKDKFMRHEERITELEQRIKS